MFCDAFPDLSFFIFTAYVPHLLYYSHLPAMIISLLLGFFVFLNNKTNRASKLLLYISIAFSLWIIIDILLWTQPDSRMIMFLWPVVNFIEVFVIVTTLYFAFVFIENKDIGIRYKIFFGFLIISYTILTSTTLNLVGFDRDLCEPRQGILKYYLYSLEIFVFVWFVIYLIRKIIHTRSGERTKIVYFSIGVFFFLASFSGANIIASLTERWEILQYGLFGMPIFMAFLAYLIVQYKAFEIKLLRAQALIVALVILIGSQFAFVRNPTNRILTGVTLTLAMTFGWWLLRTIKADDLKKEELQEMAIKLGEAYDKLKQLDRAKSEFVSIASHQLRTPLTAIKGFISLLLDGTYGKMTVSTRTILEKVYLSNERLIRLVEDLLNISRIESGRLTFKFESNSIHELLADIVENMKFAAKNKALYLDYKPLAKEIAPFYFDKDKLREVISNLIDNAIKYTKKGGVTVSLKEVSEIVLSNDRNQNSRTENFVQVIISDTGIGIEKGEERYIFEKFQRGKDVSRVHTEGVGLGLYVAEKIVQSHQGKIWAESEGLGHGSRFILQLKKRVPTASRNHCRQSPTF